jgi:hypothetical protein
MLCLQGTSSHQGHRSPRHMVPVRQDRENNTFRIKAYFEVVSRCLDLRHHVTEGLSTVAFYNIEPGIKGLTERLCNLRRLVVSVMVGKGNFLSNSFATKPITCRQRRHFRQGFSVG